MSVSSVEFVADPLLERRLFHRRQRRDRIERDALARAHPASTSIAPSAVFSPRRSCRNLISPPRVTTYAPATSLRWATVRCGDQELAALPVANSARANMPG